MKDFVGREIKAGDTVVYPVYCGSKLSMRRMTVMSTDNGKIGGLNPEGRRVYVSNLSNIVVVKPPEVAK